MICFRVTWWRWVIPVAVCIQYFLVYGCLYNYSILFVSLQKEFDSGAVLAGWPGSLSNALSNLASPFTAFLLMQMRNRTVLVLGHVIFCAGTMLTSVIPALGYAVVTYGVLVGVGTNFVVHAVTGMVLEWFRRDNFGRANGIVVLGSSLGLLAFSPLISFCINHYGWRRALRYLSGGVLVLGVIASLVLTDPPTGGDDGDRKNSRRDVEEGPGEDANMERIALNEVEALDSDSPTETIPADEDLPGDDQEPGRIQEDKMSVASCDVEGSSGRCGSNLEVYHMMTHIDPWAWTIGTCLAMVGWTFFIINFASFMDGRGLSSDQIPVVIIFLAVGEITGKIVICFIGEHFPCQRVYVLAASTLLGTVALGFMTVAQTFPHMVALSIISGLIRSVLFGTSNAVTADLFVNSYSSNGVMVLAFFPYGIGALLGAPLSGGLYDITGDYTLSLIVIAAIFVCSSAAVIFIPIRKRMKSLGLYCYSTETREVQL